jgi:S-DNA-T family DNA segregation ATPase FtsK/SpoIIIE
MGAENLLGEGDMLYLTAAMGVPVRIHGSAITIREVKKVVADLKGRAKPAYIDLTAVTAVHS